MTYAKPLPQVTKDDRPFWEGTRQHRLLLPKCRACGHVWFPPYTTCARCLSFDRDWVQASGRGNVWGFVEMVQPYISSFAKDIPYNVVLVQLDEGPLMFSNLVGTPYSEIRVGLPVEAVFEGVTPEITLVKFRPRL